MPARQPCSLIFPSLLICIALLTVISAAEDKRRVGIALNNEELKAKVAACNLDGWTSEDCKDINNWDVSAVTDMANLFLDSSFTGNISDWDVSSVTTMAAMFQNSPFTGDISKWDVSAVNTMHAMFYQSSFNGNIANWDVSAVNNMRGVFSLSSFNGNISNWDVSAVNDMAAMLSGCPFNGDISNWDVSAVKTMRWMFVLSPFTGDISKWDVSAVNNMADMFRSSSFTGNISKWDVSAVNYMSAMFQGSSFNGNIADWDVSAVTDMTNMFSESNFTGDLCPWNLDGSGKTMTNMFVGSPLQSIGSCRPECAGCHSQTTRCVEPEGKSWTCVIVACDDPLEEVLDGECSCTAGTYDDGTSCTPCPAGTTSSAGSTSSDQCFSSGGSTTSSTSYGVTVAAQHGACTASTTGAGCWHISLELTGSPPAQAKTALYLYGGGTPKPLPCSLEMSKCECLAAITAADMYHATTIGSLSANVCPGEAYDSGAIFPAIGNTMYNESAPASGIEVHVSGSIYTIELADSALVAIDAAGGVALAELHVGFLELLPAGSVDAFDAIGRETRVTLQKTSYASFSSSSAQKSSAISFSKARLHHVHDTGLGEAYYVAVSFVIDFAARRSINDIHIPVDSVVVKNGPPSGSTISVSCAGDVFSGTTGIFNTACGPFPSETSLPFCSTTLEASTGNHQLASLYLPLSEAPQQDSLVVEFVVTTEGTDAPTLETIVVTISNLGIGGGFVDWCESDVAASLDLVSAVDLGVTMYTGVVLQDDTGLDSLTIVSDNGNVVSDTYMPVAQPTLMDGVITVTANYDSSTYGVELVKLAAAYIENPDASDKLEDYITLPSASYHPATGEVGMDTSAVCLSNIGCEVKDLVVAGALQGSDGNGKSAAALAVHDAAVDASTAGTWMQEVAGTANPFINSVGSHFYSQVVASGPEEAYWINPRKDPASTSIAVGSSISTAVVVFALWKVDIAAGGRRSSRTLLQTVQGSRGDKDKEAVSAAVRIEVSAASLAASVLGVSQDLVTAWVVEFGIQDAVACLPTSELMASARSFLDMAFGTAAASVREVHIASIRVNQGAIDCTHANRRSTTASTPSILVDALVIFAEDHPSVDLSKLRRVPGILSAVQSEGGALVEVVETRDTVADVEGAAEPKGKDTPSQGSQLAVVAGAAAAAVLLLLGVAVWVLRRGNRGCEVPVVHVASLSYLSGKEKELTANLDNGVIGGAEEA